MTEVASETEYPRLIDALLAYLRARAITTRVEQAAAMGLGEHGPIAIARYLAGRTISAEIAMRIARTMRVQITYDGTGWHVERLDAAGSQDQT